eukprot:gene15413-34014_t
MAGGFTADDVLGCRGFDEARDRYPDVIKKALIGGPPEDMFRTHWAPDAQYHGSLRSLILQAVTTIGAAAAAAGPQPQPAGSFAKPEEDVFRAHWAPGTQFHSSLRAVIAKSVSAAVAAAPAAAADAPAQPDPR